MGLRHCIAIRIRNLLLQTQRQRLFLILRLLVTCESKVSNIIINIKQQQHTAELCSPKESLENQGTRHVVGHFATGKLVDEMMKWMTSLKRNITFGNNGIWLVVVKRVSRVMMLYGNTTNGRIIRLLNWCIKFKISARIMLVANVWKIRMKPWNVTREPSSKLESLL